MSQRRVLITGAGSGLGLALALRYARSGARVACVDLIQDRVEAARASLPGQGHIALLADVGSDDSMQALFDQVQKEWGGVDVLINNAGIASGGPMIETTMEEWRKLLEVDLLSVVRGCRLFLPGMLAAGKGQILSTASFAGLASAPGIMTYGVAKAAVVALSEQLRAEVFDKGILVGVICPSFFKTNLIDTAVGSDKARKMALRLMDTSPDTVDSVADNVFASAERGQFMILPTKHEPMRWRMKRWFPNMYFRMLTKLVKQHTK
ncbi:MAG TPA: SDR family NAD(P)-dependent oxidoreductase [Arenimonas sp.]|nr:SDR family NAD(P)-dependent oxidoreductase [Arenimonas sp.]HPO24430.1 SDR family NAD(P)-dependent oxidoreductase [Arenimonas sp.]HPW31441.1 SDR family NAD(P)-dependent oxidoreductase [Arenimonas sp.]